MTNTPSRTGLFLVNYDIGTLAIGSPNLTLSLTVNTVHKLVNGFGQITQAVSPPLDLHTRVDGSFTYMTVMPDVTHILVVATGYPPVQWPPGGGIGPVLQPNFELRMVLDKGWQGGTASYSFVEASGRRVEIEKAVVTSAGQRGGPIHTLYGPAMQEAAASGDLARMKQLAAQAEQHLSQSAEIQSALAALKAEIGRSERAR
ncbi:DUF1842 domain-containing protein [Sorangium sp. So ce296]|uniref:DUF1842 domain-containing protein n=1 Tax=Sorangium sp. So ce296 TaxID=3133296 RepID=UPI003F5F7BA6